MLNLPNLPKINLPSLSSKKNQETVAVDLGSSFVKIVQIGKQGEILQTLTVPNTLGYSVPTKTTQIDGTANFLKGIFEENHLPKTNLSLALPEKIVSTQVISIPTLTDSELASSINWQAQQYIPIPKEELVLNYQVLYRPDKKDSATQEMRVLLIGINQENLNNLLAAYKQAGLEPTVLETESLSVMRHLPADLRGDSASMIMNFGASGFDLCLTKGTEIAMALSHQTGSLMITRALMNTFNLPMDKAEEYKWYYGVDARHAEGKIAQAIVPLMQTILGDIKNTLTFFNNQNPTQSISRLFVCGGGAMMPGFPELLAANLNLEVLPLGVFDNTVGSIPENNHLIYAVASGLTKRKR